MILTDRDPALQIHEPILDQRHGIRPGDHLGALHVKGDAGNELWTEMRGKFKRWILRPDREGGKLLIALPAGDFAIDPAYYRGEVPKQWKSRVKIEDSGAYEIIEGSYQRHRFDLWFNGQVMRGEWILEKVREEKEHRSWRLQPVA